MSTGGGLLGVSVLELRTDQRGLVTGLSNAERLADASGRRMQQVTGRHLASIGQNMSRLGNQWTRTITLPLAAGGIAVTKVAMDFDAALTQVQTQAGASRKEIEMMRGAILKLAPAVGQTPTNLANALFHIESAGLHGAHALDVMTQSAKLAAISHADLEQTTNAVVAVMKTAPKDVGNATQAIGLLNATVGAGNLRMADLTAALSTGILPAAKSVGLGLRDVGAAIDVMTSRGVPAEAAATRLRMTFALMAAPTSKAVAELKSVGISSSQLATDMRKPDGLVIAIQDLKSHMEAAGLSATQQNQLITRAFGGGRSSSAITTMIQNVGDLQKHFDEIGKKSGAKQVRDEWGTTQKDLSFKWEQMKADAAKTAIEVGTKVGPELLKVGKEVAHDAADIASAFASLPPGVQHAIITGGFMAAAVGPALKVAGVLTTSVGRLADAAKVVGNLSGLHLPSSISAALAKNQAVATMEVGTLIAKSMVGGPGGGPAALPGDHTPVGAPVPKAPEIPSESAFGRFARSPLGATGLAAAGIGAFGSASAAQGGVLNQLNAAAHGVDPTAVLHLVGLPAVSDLLPTVKKRVPLSAQDIAMLGEGFSLQDINAAHRIAAGKGGKPAGVTQATAHGQLGQTASAQQEQKDFGMTAIALSKLENRQAGIKATANALDGLAKKASRLGDVRMNFADRLGSELLRSKNVESKGVQQIIAQMNKLAPGARASASQAMVLMTQTLEQQGKLPKGSTAKLVTDMLGQYKSMRDKGGKYFNALLQDGGVAVAQLKDRIAHSTGQARKDALEQLHALQAGAGKAFSQMESQAASSMKSMSFAVRNGSGVAAQAAEGNFQRVASAVGRAMNSGLLSTKTGSKLIGDALNSMLTAFGQKPIPLAGLSATSEIQWQKWWQQGATGTGSSGPGHRARGGLVQFGRAGDRGPDAIPVNMGGVPIMVGSGELGAVFTGEQQAVANDLLSPVGGLPGLFSSHRTPHPQTRRYAGGGIVTASDFGGPGDPGTGSTGYRGDNLYQHPDSFAELNMGTALGHLPYLAPITATLRGKTAKLFKRDIGAGGPGLNGHVRAVDLWFQAAQALGFSGLEDILVNGGAGVNVIISGGGGGGTIAQIPTPKVTGKGTIPDLARAALKLVDKGANQYAASLAPTANTGIPGLYSGPVPAGGSVFDGHVVANWIIPILKWAETHGWGGSVNSGYRSFAQQAAINASGAFSAVAGTSNHESLNYPGGAVDVTDPSQLLAVLRGYPGQPKLVGGVLGAVDPEHFSATGHARGGLINALRASRGLVFASNGYSSPSKPSTSKPKAGKKPKPVKRTKPAKAVKLPKLKAPPGFDQAQVDQLAALDTLAGQVSDWGGFIGNLHGVTSVSPLVSMLDGSSVINWGDPNAATGVLSGLVDPSTNQQTKGIYDRLREIGAVSDRMNPKAPSLKDTELGIDETLLGLYYQEQTTAAEINKDFAPWLTAAQKRVLVEQAQASWLGMAADTNTPFGKLPERVRIGNKSVDVNFRSFGPTSPGVHVHGGPAAMPIPIEMWGTEIRKKAREYKNMVALIAWLKRRQSDLPDERRKRDDALSTRFDALKKQISGGATTASFDAGDLLRGQLHDLDHEETAAKHAFGKRLPKGWTGDKQTWEKQRKAEHELITGEFDARRAALSKALDDHHLGGKLSRSTALSAQAVMEGADKHALADQFSHKGKVYKDAFASDTQVAGVDKKLLTGFLSQVKRAVTKDQSALATATDSGGTRDQLAAALSPIGTLAVDDIANMVSIVIPGALREIADLTGTIIPPQSGGATQDSTLAGLYQDKATSLAQELAVSQAQYKVLSAALPPFGGTFHSGGLIPGPAGEERMVKALSGERIVPIGGDGTDVHLHFKPGTEWLKDFVDVRVEQQSRGTSRRAGQAARLPGAGGGLRVRA